MSDNVLQPFDELITNPDAKPSADWVEECAQRYPYFYLPALLAIDRSLDLGEDSEKMLHSVSLASADRRGLALKFGDFFTRFGEFYPEEEKPAPADATSTIDKFLDRYGNSSAREISALETAIFNPQPEYVSFLEQEDAGVEAEVPQTEEDRRIAAFITAQNTEEERDAAQALNADDAIAPGEKRRSAKTIDTPVASSFKESLATAYIRQGKFSAALDILQRIKTENPQVGAPLIDDRIRFLKKLIIVESLSK